MDENDIKEQIGELTRQNLVSNLRTVAMFTHKMDMRIDGSFTKNMPGHQVDREIYYTLQTKTVPETEAPRIDDNVDTDAEYNKDKEVKVLEDIIRDAKYLNYLEDQEYEELPPEYNPEREENEKEQVKTFLNARLDGLYAAYEYVTGELFGVKLDQPEYKQGSRRETLTMAKNRLKEIQGGEEE